MAGGYPVAPMANSYQPAPMASGYQMANGYQAGPMANNYQPVPMAPYYQPAPMGNPNGAPGQHDHHGLFPWRRCVECQRAEAKRRYGIDLPPPPSFTPGVAMQGQVVSAPGARCAACEGTVISGPVVAADPHSPGYTVVGGAAAMPAGAPGYAVAGNGAISGAPGYAVAGGGAEPSPIAVARSTQPQWGNPSIAANGARPGAAGYDPNVMPSSIPPAQNALPSPGHARPHVIRHLLGVPEFGAHRREREDRARQKHAAIAYDQPNAPVTEIPASMVYSNKGH
jgi:hypothetical protein